MDMWLCRMPGQDYKILPRYCVWMMFFCSSHELGLSMLDYSPALVLLFQVDYLEMRIEYA